MFHQYFFYHVGLPFSLSHLPYFSYFSVILEHHEHRITSDLIPNGRNIAVTSKNRHRYIRIYSDYLLNIAITLQSRAFFLGMSQIVDPRWLRMFESDELSALISGQSVIDLRDMANETVFHNVPYVFKDIGPS